MLSSPFPGFEGLWSVIPAGPAFALKFYLSPSADGLNLNVLSLFEICICRFPAMGGKAGPGKSCLCSF